MIYKHTSAICRGYNIVMWIRMTWSLPAAVPQMMLCLIKLVKHRVIWSLLLSWRHSTWLGKHLNISVLVNSVKIALMSYNLKFVCIWFSHAMVKELLKLPGFHRSVPAGWVLDVEVCFTVQKFVGILFLVYFEHLTLLNARKTFKCVVLWLACTGVVYCCDKP